MHRKWIAGLAVTAILLAAGTAAYARYGQRGGWGFGHERHLAMLEARLKLTPEQSKQVRGLIADRRAKMMEQFSSGRENREALIKEVFKDNPNQQEIQKRVADLQQQHAQMIQQLVSTGLELNKVLTPEQRVEMQKMIAEHAQVREHMRQRMQERRQQQQPQPEKPKAPGPPGDAE